MRNRFVTVEEIAAMVAWLCSAENSFTTGGVFDISGGWSIYFIFFVWKILKKHNTTVDIYFIGINVIDRSMVFLGFFAASQSDSDHNKLKIFREERGSCT